jgi:hypothetical protein
VLVHAQDGLSASMIRSQTPARRHRTLRQQHDLLALPMRAGFGKYRLQFIPDGLAPKAKLTSRFLRCYVRR